MATFVLIHGAGDVGWYWHLAEAAAARGHQTIAPDLPCDNDTASLDDYAATVADAAAGRPDLVIVGQSYGAFTATLAASQLPARLLVLLAGMIPVPAKAPASGGSNTGYQHAAEQQARLDGGKTGHDDPLISFYNGVPRPLAEEALRRGGRGESSAVWNTPWPLDAWPDVPTRFIAGTDDHFFPATFMRKGGQGAPGHGPRRGSRLSLRRAQPPAGTQAIFSSATSADPSGRWSARYV